MDTAEVESLGYCQVVLNKIEKVQPLFIMPYTMQEVALSLCWPMSTDKDGHKLAITKICDESPPSANFFDAVKFAIHYFNFPTENFKFQPIQDTQLQKKLIIDRHYMYLAGGKVYKLYDTKTESHAKPNVKIVEDVLGKDLPEWYGTDFLKF